MKIILMCSAGSSTGALADKMTKYSDDNNLGHEIKAVSMGVGKEIAQDWDVILLGPQVGFAVKKISALFPDKPCAAIPPMMYGRMQYEEVIKFATELKVQ